MSLINEALKRTKDAQQQNPPPASGPALKPVDPATAKSASNAKTLLYIMVACVVLGNAMLFLAIKDRSGKKEAAPPTAPAAVAAAPTPTASPVVARPSVATSVPAPAPAKPAPAPAAVVSPAPTLAPAVPETNPVAVPAVAIQPEPPKPAPLKLQSIIFNPSRPSAMVSGKFVFVGDKVQGFRVAAIDQESVTLIGNGQTNVLSLP